MILQVEIVFLVSKRPMKVRATQYIQHITEVDFAVFSNFDISDPPSILPPREDLSIESQRRWQYEYQWIEHGVINITRCIGIKVSPILGK